MKAKADKGNGLVYSTHGAPETTESETNFDETPTLEPRKQSLRITLDKKMKGGKKATVIYNFVGKPADLEALGKHLKTRMSVGGTVKDGEIILQGDCLDKVKTELTALGYGFKVAGV
jgi:translation initiation factor 1